MPFTRPTLTDLETQAAGDIATAVPGADALLRFSNLGILGRLLAALVNGLYGYLDWIARQAVPFTSTDVYLQGWAALKNVFQKAPTGAGTAPGNPIQAQFTGANGTPLPNEWPLTRSDGVPYITTGEAVVAGGVVTVPLLATGTGSATTCVVGQIINLASAIAGINSAGVITAAGSPGTDLESQDDFRGRMLQAYQAPPMGGADADYLAWALAVAGVTRAWVVPLEGGAGTVSVYFMMDDAESAFGGFPQGGNGGATNETRTAAATGDQLVVANTIYPLRPVTALVSAKAPGNNGVTFTLNGIAGVSGATKTAIAAAISAVMLAQAAVGGAVDGNGDALPGIDVSYIESAIAAVAGTAGFVITAIACANGSVTPSPAGNITSDAGFLATLAGVTYT